MTVASLGRRMSRPSRRKIRSALLLSALALPKEMFSLLGNVTGSSAETRYQQSPSKRKGELTG
jgi:hypothetical protein